MIFLQIIFSVFLSAYENCNYSREIKTYYSPNIFYSKDEALKAALKSVNQSGKSGYKSLGYGVDEKDGYYFYYLNYSLDKDCLYYEIKNYEIDYSNDFSSVQALKRLDLKERGGIKPIYSYDDVYNKKITVSYVLPFNNFRNCGFDVKEKRYYFYLNEKYFSDKILTNIENSFVKNSIPFLFISADEDESYIYVDYLVCETKDKYPAYEMKRYESFDYNYKNEAYSAAIKAVKALNDSGGVVFYFDVYEKNSNYFFFADYFVKTLNFGKDFKINILSYYDTETYRRKYEAEKKMKEKEKIFSSSGFYPVESAVFDNGSGYSFQISYISANDKEFKERKSKKY
ncbi:MAG: hypothetical protein ACP5SD_01760 [Elusimicrobiales bacterium]